MVNAGQVVSKSQIRDRVWDYSFDGKVNMVEVYISYLRKKLDVHGPAAHPHGPGHRLLHAGRARRPPAPTPGPEDRMTLRLRLLLLLVGIVAAGLIISDVVTYNALRSFLTTRVDQQLDAAAFPVGRALLSSSGLGPQVPAAPGGTPAPADTVRADRPFRRRVAFRNGGGLRGPTGAADGACSSPRGPTGSSGAHQGKIEAHLFFSYGGKAPSRPDHPGHAARVGPGVPCRPLLRRPRAPVRRGVLPGRWPSR